MTMAKMCCDQFESRCHLCALSFVRMARFWRIQPTYYSRWLVNGNSWDRTLLSRRLMLLG